MTMKTVLMLALKAAGALLLLITALVGYNYLRHIIYWLPSESVTFESSDGTVLAGTLLKPDSEPPYSAVVMLHGSGPENRSGPGYRILSNAIARSGVAVLFYDKRGTGESSGDFDSALYRDFITDGIAAVQYLANREDVDASRVGLHANSEGGWFAPEIAVRTGQIAYIFNRVSPAFSWIDTNLWETRNDMLAAGIAEDDVQPLLDITLRRWQYYIDAAADPSLAAGPVRDAINAELQRVIDEIPGAASEVPASLAPYDEVAYEGYAADIGYDPVPWLEQLDIPMIYTFGGTDINIPTSQCVTFLESFRQEHDKDIEILVIDDVGHPMAAPRGFLYGGYVPELMQKMREFYGAWALR